MVTKITPSLLYYLAFTDFDKSESSEPDFIRILYITIVDPPLKYSDKHTFTKNMRKMKLSKRGIVYQPRLINH